MLKILQVRLQQYVNWELQMCKMGLEKAEEPEIKFATLSGSWRKQENARKTSASASLTVGFTANCGKFFKRWDYQTTLSALWETCMLFKKQQSDPHMEQLTGSKLGKEYDKAEYCHPAYLTYMQSTSYEMPSWVNRKLESRFPGEISTTLDM